MEAKLVLCGHWYSVGVTTPLTYQDLVGKVLDKLGFQGFRSHQPIQIRRKEFSH